MLSGQPAQQIPLCDLQFRTKKLYQSRWSSCINFLIDTRITPSLFPFFNPSLRSTWYTNQHGTAIGIQRTADRGLFRDIRSLEWYGYQRFVGYSSETIL